METLKFRKITQIPIFESVIKWIFLRYITKVLHIRLSVRDVQGPVTILLQVKMLRYDWTEEKTHIFPK